MVNHGLTPTDLAYYAGFIDGEGCFGIYRSSPRFSMTNTHLPILEELQAWFGGTIRDDMRDGKPAWQWTLYTNQGLPAFLDQILPYLREKWQQAMCAKECLELPKGHPRKLDLMREIRDLKR